MFVGAVLKVCAHLLPIGLDPGVRPANFTTADTETLLRKKKETISGIASVNF